jgi:hypothetical protein
LEQGSFFTKEGIFGAGTGNFTCQNPKSSPDEVFGTHRFATGTGAGSFEDFEVQTILTFEMIIDSRLIDASFGDDVPHARTLEALSPRTYQRQP